MSKTEEPRRRSRQAIASGEPPGTGRPVAEDLALLARSTDLVGYFGYGSLVNRATLTTKVVAAIPARLGGWRRIWRRRPVMEADAVPGNAPAHGLVPSLLTAEPDPESAIDGLLIIDFAANLGEVDVREVRYHRRDIVLSDLELGIGGLQQAPEFTIDPALRLHVYEARSELPAAQGPSPILRSYLDAVMQGFLREFGPEGLNRFVSETGAFDAPIHEDREAPLYPRAVRLSREEAELFEAALGRRGAASGN